MTPKQIIKQLPQVPEGRKLPFSDFYIVTEDGKIFSLYKWRYLKPEINKLGYVKVMLTDREGKNRLHSVHRLVAHCYCPIPARLQDHPKPEVNHKDGKRAHNHYTNLEWCTHAENIRHAFEVLGRKRSKGRAKGFTTSEETKELQSLAKQGERHPKFKGWYTYQGERYTSYQALGDVLGTNSMQAMRLHKGDKSGIGFEPSEFRTAPNSLPV